MRLLLTVPLILLAVTGLGQPVVDSLQKAITSDQGEKKIRALQALVNEYSRTNLAKAKTLAHEGIILAREQQFRLLLSGFYTQLVSLHQNTGHTDSVQFYLEAVQALASHTPGKEGEKIHANYYSSAGLFHKKQGNYKAAILFMLKAVAVAKTFSTPESTAGQFLNIGNTYINLGDYRKALHYHLEALRLFETAGNKKGESFCYQNIGEDFIELKQYAKALVYIKHSLELKSALGDKRGVGNAYSALGRVYLGLKNYAQSFHYLTQALQVASELQLVQEEAKILLSLGQLYRARNDLTGAREHFRKGKQRALETGDSTTIVLADREIISLETDSKEKLVAEKRLLANIRTILAAGNKREEVSQYKALADLYAKNGEAEKSLLYTTKYYKGKDSLLSKDVQMEISRLEEQYKHEKKEAEIRLLKKDQQIIQSELRQQKQIQYAVVLFALLLVMVAILLVNRYRVVSKAKRMVEMEKMRNDIAKDLHDDIGSTLSSINIMSRVLLQQAQAGTTDIAGLQKIKEQSAAILENMSDIVWAINPHNDTAEKMIYKMREFAAEILDPLNIRYHFVEEGAISSLKLDPQKRKDLFLIFKEAINNAAKYSYCQSIQITLSANGQTLLLQVADDGKGFDPLTVKKGNGLRNLDERSQSAGGSLTYTSRSGKGTLVHLEVPIT
jgi:signal transduction histidine kinase